MTVKRLNLTLVVEEDLLRQARAVAARRRTSVNEMVRDYLEDVVSREGRRLAAWERIRSLVEEPSVRFSSRRPTRADLHER